MKLKSKYILRTVADKTVAIAIEQGNEKTDGVITLNDTGAFIFAQINEGNDFDTIVEIAAETGYIKEDDKERLIKFRNNPSDESWIGGDR